MNIFIDNLVKEKSEQWRRSIEQAYNLKLIKADEEFLEIVKACVKHSQLDLLSKEFFRFSKHDAQNRSAYKLFIKEVDDSDYNLSEWIEVLEFIFNWLDESKKTAKFDTILGYLNCCVQTPEIHLFDKSFIETVKEMLAEHGFERSVDI